MTTYEQLHAGDIVLGHDGKLWGVAGIDHTPPLSVVLVRYGRRVTGYPPAGTPVTIVTPVDFAAETDAGWTLVNAGLGPVNIVSELWEG